jgi:hypothetical protein
MKCLYNFLTPLLLLDSIKTEEKFKKNLTYLKHISSGGVGGGGGWMLITRMFLREKCSTNTVAPKKISAENSVTPMYTSNWKEISHIDMIPYCTFSKVAKM